MNAIQPPLQPTLLEEEHKVLMTLYFYTSYHFKILDPFVQVTQNPNAMDFQYKLSANRNSIGNAENAKFSALLGTYKGYSELDTQEVEQTYRIAFENMDKTCIPPSFQDEALRNGSVSSIVMITEAIVNDWIFLRNVYLRFYSYV